MGSTIDAGSVSVWLKEVRFGGNSAAEQLWQRYQAPLQRVALRALGHTDRQVADEEDVVIQSFSAFLRRIADDGYPQLSNRDELWRLLARITRNYAGKQRQKLSCQKRGGHLERRRQARLWLQQLADQSMSAELRVEFADTLRSLLDRAGDEEMRTIVLGRLQGMSVEELAKQLNRSCRTIERRLAMIRKMWIAEAELA